jgi:hypothetical protein
MSGVSRLNLWIRIQEKSGEIVNLQMVCVCVCVCVFFFLFFLCFTFLFFFKSTLPLSTKGEKGCMKVLIDDTAFATT